MSKRPEDRGGAQRTGVERLPMLIIFLVNPLLVTSFFADQALLRWLLAAAALAVAVAGNRQLATRMASSLREVWPLLALAGLIAAHLLRGTPVAEGVRWLLLITVGTAAYLYCRALAEADRQRCLRWLAMSGGAIGAYAVAQACGWDVFSYATESWMYRVVTTFGHRNFTATFLLGALFATLARSQGEARDRWWWLFLLLTYAGLLATGARFPALAATVALVVTCVSSRRLRRVAVVVLLLLSAWLGMVIARGELAAVVTRSETVLLRLHLYRSLPVLGMEQPLFGIGPGAFAHRQPAAAGPRPAGFGQDVVFLHAHLLPAEVLVELGLVGLLLCAWFLHPVHRSLIRTRPWQWRPLAWCYLCWLVINLYDVSFFSYAGWVVLWPTVAFLGSQDESTPDVPAVSVVQPVRVALCLTMAASSITLLPILWSSHLCFRAGAALSNQSATTAAGLYQRAAQVWPLTLDDRYRRAVATLAAGRTGPALSQLQEVERDAPGFSAVRYNLAVAHARLGRYTEATVWIDRHLQIRPADAEAIRMRERLATRQEPASSDDP